MKKILLLTLVSITGCESLELMNNRRTQINTETQNKMSQAIAIPSNNRMAHFSDSAYIANPRDAIRYVEPLPTVFSQQITINESTPLTLHEIAERITRTTGLPVRLLSETTTQTQLPATTTGGLPPPPPGIPTNLTLPVSGLPGSTSTTIMSGYSSMHLSYSNGPLSGLLDLIASKNNVSWRYQNGAVEIYRFMTKTFKVHSLPGSSELSASVERGGSSSTSGSGGGGGSPQSGGMGGGSTATITTGSTGGNTTTQMASIDAPELSQWKDLENSIKTMLGPDGHVVVSQSTGSVTITDTPERVGQIEKFVDNTNKIMTQQVTFHYRVLSVDKNDASRMGFDLTAAFNALNQNYGLSLSSMALPQSAAGSALLSALIPNTATGRMGQFSGSKLLIDALETQGHVSTVTSGTVTTLNNKPAPVQVVNEKSYIATVQALQTANVGSSTGVQQGKVVTGFSMNMIPHILDDDRVLLHCSINISSLTNLVERVVGNTTVQSPEIDTRSFMPEISMRAGETLILSGFERAGGTLNKTGSLFQGGGEAATENNATIVILITPILTAG